MRAGVETHLCGVLIQIISNIVNPPENVENFPYSEDTLLSGRYLLGIIIQVLGCQVAGLTH